MTAKERDDVGEKWTYEDPEKVFARRQGKDLSAPSRTCLGCQHILKSPVWRDKSIACNLRIRRPSPCVEDSRRCNSYEEK